MGGVGDLVSEYEDHTAVFDMRKSWKVSFMVIPVYYKEVSGNRHCTIVLVHTFLVQISYRVDACALNNPVIGDMTPK